MMLLVKSVAVLLLLLLSSFGSTIQPAEGLPMMELTDEKMAMAIGGDQYVFTMFYVDWCPACKRMVIAWRALADEFVHDPTIQFAMMDAEYYAVIAEPLGKTTFPFFHLYLTGIYGDEVTFPTGGEADVNQLRSFLKQEVRRHKIRTALREELEDWETLEEAVEAEFKRQEADTVNAEL